MNAAEVMSAPIVAVRPVEPIAHAKRMMLRYRVNRLLVMERGRPVGFLSMRDIAENLAVQGPLWRRRPIDEIPIAQIMRREVISVAPGTRLERVAAIMLRRGISSVVVAENGNPLGIVTKTDLVRYFAGHLKEKFKVVALMTPNPISVSPAHSIARVVELLRKHRISRVVVVDSGRPVGIITESDLGFTQLEIPWRPPVRVLRYARKTERGGKRTARYVKYVGLLTAEDIMTPHPLTAGMYDDVAVVAHTMLKRGISGLPVVERGGTLIGIITKTDIVKGISQLGAAS
jgi:CBS domain-containing protein